MRHDVGGATLASQESLSERGHGEPWASALSLAREISRVPGCEWATSDAMRVGRCHSSAPACARRKNDDAVRRRTSRLQPGRTLRAYGRKDLRTKSGQHGLRRKLQ